LTTAPPRHARPLADTAVLLPAYNCQADLERTLASLREPEVVQVLIVDDGSTPPLRAPDLPGLDINILRLTPNGGIERALAAGVDALARRGACYIARIDAGDVALPGRLSRQREWMDAHPRAGVLGCWTDLVTRGGDTVMTLRPPVAPADVRRQRFFRTCLVHPATMLRTAAVLDAGNYRARYPAAEDLDLFVRIMARWDCANLPEVGLRYELNEGGISATRRRVQVASTLRLIAAHLRWTNPYDWGGLARNLLHLALPYRLLRTFKRALLRG
jgi:glycosyltransferase involved in cell wall biosynthesis